MTRFGFFVFNLLLVGAIYGIVYMNGAKPVTIAYVLRNFSIPYIVLILFMLIFSTIRWFMHHDTEVGKEIVAWANALWFVPVLTVLAIYLLGGIQGNLWEGMHGLMSAR